MADTWKTVKAEQVKAGETVRTQSGERGGRLAIETSFMGMPNMLAFIEDTPDRWFKQPMTADADVEVRSS